MGRTWKSLRTAGLIKSCPYLAKAVDDALKTAAFLLDVSRMFCRVCKQEAICLRFVFTSVLLLTPFQNPATPLLSARNTMNHLHLIVFAFPLLTCSVRHENHWHWVWTVALVWASGVQNRRASIVRLKKTYHLNFDFIKTLPTVSILLPWRQAMVYSKACVLSYKCAII